MLSLSSLFYPDKTENAFSLSILKTEILEEDKIFTHEILFFLHVITSPQQQLSGNKDLVSLSPMRCKRHTVDFTSNVGVCASCLHERLLSLAASIAAVEDNNNNNNRQSRKSSNPRSGAGGGEDLGISGNDFESNRSEKSKEVKVSRISNPFRGRSDSNAKSESCSSSRSWISSFLSTGRSKKQPTNKACNIEDVISRCRGMSPARDTRAEDGNEVPSESIEETPGRPRRTTPAMKTPGRRKVMTGMGFCLSPLVRARPNCPFKRKSRFPSEIAGEVTTGEKPHISEAASFVANRSKKLVDLGRGNPRR